MWDIDQGYLAHFDLEGFYIAMTLSFLQPQLLARPSLTVAPTSVRFGQNPSQNTDSFQPSSFAQKFLAMQRIYPRFDQYSMGQVFLKTADGNVVPAYITEIDAGDADQVDAWFSDDNDNAYESKRWHQWWLDKMDTTREQEPNTKIYKIITRQVRSPLPTYNRVLGVMMVEEHVPEAADSENLGKPITLLRGLRVDPKCSREFADTPDYLGVGKSLVIDAVMQSVKNGDTGFGITSSPGVEAFYESVFGEPVGGRDHEDDDGAFQRAYYKSNGDDRWALLTTQLQSTDARHRQYIQETYPDEPDAIRQFFGG